MTFIDYFSAHGGMFFALLGAGLAMILAGTGSARAVGMTGEAATGVVIDEAQKFGKTLLFQLLPGTQGLYGFVIALLIVLRISPNMPLSTGLMMLAAALPVGIVGLTSAPAQAKVAVAGLNILIKNEPQMMKGVIYAVMVETYAILAFVVSIILFVNIPA